jgi:cobalt-zinc-cadmium efflux system membrane fusion protein
MRFILSILVASSAISFLGVAGCSDKPETVATEAVGHDVDGDQHAAHDHSGWWCTEHGVPEGECALCDTSLVADFKAKDDWCDEHSRPNSQCFTCNPELLDKFAARYEAKFGELPPNPTE